MRGRTLFGLRGAKPAYVGLVVILLVGIIAFLLIAPIQVLPGPGNPLAGVPICQAGQYCGWEWANVPLSFHDAQTPLRSVIYVTPSIVVAVGDTGTILRSTDAGVNWSLVPSPVPDAFLRVINATPSGFLLAGGLNATIIASDTEGASWLVYPTHGLKGNISEMGFLSGSWGYASTSEGLYFTTTEGQGWTPVKLPQPGGAYSAAFSSETTGWVNAGEGQQLPQLYYTTTAGANWSIIKLPSRVGEITSTIVVTGPTSAWVLEDQGTVWNLTSMWHYNETQLNTAQHTWTEAVIVGPLGGEYGWVSSDDANTFYTYDGGKYWIEEGVPQIPEIYGLAFSSPEDGVAVGDGIVWHTTDAGEGSDDGCGLASGTVPLDADAVPVAHFSGVTDATSAGVSSWPSALSLCYPYPDLEYPLLLVPAVVGTATIMMLAVRSGWGPEPDGNSPMPTEEAMREVKRRRKMRERHRYVRFK